VKCCDDAIGEAHAAALHSPRVSPAVEAHCRSKQLLRLPQRITGFRGPAFGLLRFGRRAAGDVSQARQALVGKVALHDSLFRERMVEDCLSTPSDRQLPLPRGGRLRRSTARLTSPRPRPMIPGNLYRNSPVSLYRAGRAGGADRPGGGRQAGNEPR
jgi:hypothetical protein